MKKLTLIFWVAVLAVTAQADLTPTNAVKDSALPAATTPLAGTELVRMVQAAASRTATVDQLIAKATAQDIATSNNLAAYISGFSNTIPSRLSSSNFLTAAQAASSNFQSSAQIASSNFQSSAQIASSNFQSSAQIASSNFLS